MTGHSRDDRPVSKSDVCTLRAFSWCYEVDGRDEPFVALSTERERVFITGDRFWGGTVESVNGVFLVIYSTS